MKITLRAARVNAAYTQQDVAFEMGVTVGTVSNWETGKSTPNKASLKMLAKIYRIGDSTFLLHRDLTTTKNSESES